MTIHARWLLHLPIALLGVAGACSNGHGFADGANGSGGAFVGGSSGGFAGKGSPDSGTIGGGAIITPCAPLGGPVDVGRIGGPGRDAQSHRWTLPFATAREPRLAVDPFDNTILSVKAVDLELGSNVYGSIEGDNVVLAKFDASGQLVWARVVGPLEPLQGSVQVEALAADGEGNVFAAGAFRGTVTFGADAVTAVSPASAAASDAYLLKLDPNGEYLWLDSFGDANNQAVTSLVLDASGSATIAGYFGGLVNFGGEDLLSQRGSYGTDVFVARFDGEGAHVQSAALGSMRDEAVASIAIDGQGNTLALVVNGTGKPDGTLGPESFSVHKLDASFAPVYEREFSSMFVLAGGVAVSAGGGAVVAGFANVATEFEPGLSTPSGLFVFALDAAGTLVWHKSFSEPLQATPALAVDREGNIVLTGGFTSVDFGGGPLPNMGDLDVFVTKLDARGEHVFSQRAGSCGTDQGLRLALAATGDIYVAGSFLDAIDFGKGPVRTGNPSVFLARLAP